ncbi:MAG: gliding motility-associated C-terminal domain-containing protein, partial [Chitinophagales bacterium]|nr:gliding motility-associated C-terminal domain-containing protein [Chitinophagales bacterium]
SAGNYTVTIRDGNGCTVSQAIDVLQPSQLTLALVQDSVECFGGNDGSIIATGGGGSLPYEYAINGGAYQPSGNFGTLTAGNYSITIRDGNGCTATQTIDVLQPAQLTLALVQDSVECFGGNDGSITATGGGGSLPYEYAINGGAYQSSNLFPSLVAANYSITVRDGNGCTATQTVDVLQPSQLSVALVQDSVECFGGNDGAITATGAGGSLPYEYSINGGAYQSSNVLSSLSAGNYTVTIRDGNNCTASQTINVWQPTQLSINLSQDSVNCFGAADGSVTASAAGGSLPYEYSINGGTYQSSGSFLGLNAGNYTLRVRDANGCIASGTISVLQPSAITTVVSQLSPVSCFGGNDGSASVLAASGSPGYTYLWSNGNTGATANNLPAGFVRVTVTDAHACIRIDSVNITQPTQISITALLSNVTCYGQANGAISVAASGGVPGYSYSWIPSGTGASIGQLPPAVYTVRVTDASGCSKDSSFTITQPADLTGTITSIDITCFGANDGSASVTASGGVAPYSYLWDNGQTTPTATLFTPGTHSMVIRDANGCTEQLTVQIASPSQLEIVATPNNPICAADSNGTISVIATGGTGTYVYLWSHNDTLSSDFADSLRAGIYSITCVDANNCTAATGTNLTDPASVSVSVTVEDTALIFGESSQLLAVPSSNISGAPVYSWSPTDNLNCIDCADPIAGPLVTDATYEVIMTDANGCLAKAKVNLVVDIYSRLLAVPNAFTPNNDGSNPTFNAYGYGYKTFTMKVFNRWGEKVFESNDQNVGWDGYYKGELQLPGVYAYLVEVEYLDGKKAMKKGSVTLLR